MILALILLPAAAALAAILIRAHGARRVLLVAAAAAHAGLVTWLWLDPPRFPPMGTWLAVDRPGMLFLGITSLLFLRVSFSAVGFLRRESGATRADLFVPGCPPHPLTLLDGILRLLGRIR